MRPFLRSKCLWIILFVGFCLGVLFLSNRFQYVRMDSNSMDSDVVDPGNLAIRSGDRAIVSKRIHNPLHKGDLVLVKIDCGGTSVQTIRRIAGVPGDTVPALGGTNSILKVPDRYYYLLGDSLTALDSRQLGMFSYTQILGKVTKVIK
jgi:signal peptidase I